MAVLLSATVTVIRLIEFVVCCVYQFGTSFCCKYPVRNDELRLMHRPLLNRLLFFGVVHRPVSCPSIWVKLISVGVKIVPSCKVSLLCKISFEVRPTCAVSPMRHPERVLIKGRHLDHFLVVARVRILVLNITRSTALWVTA